MTADNMKYLIAIWFLVAETCVNCINFVPRPILSSGLVPIQGLPHLECKSCLHHNFIRPADIYDDAQNNQGAYERLLTHNDVNGRLIMNRNVLQPLLHNYFPPRPQQYGRINLLPQINSNIMQPRQNDRKFRVSQRTGFSNMYSHGSSVIPRIFPTHKQAMEKKILVPIPAPGSKTICIQRIGTSSPVKIPTTTSSVVTSPVSIEIVDMNTTESNTTKERLITTTSVSPEGLTLFFPATLPAPLYNDSTKEIRVPSFLQALDQFERNFYLATFSKLSSICPPERRENGISFVLSGLFLNLILNALSLEADRQTRAELDRILDISVSNKDRTLTIEGILNMLPTSNEELKFRWSTRLVVNGSDNARINSEFFSSLGIRVDTIIGTETPEQLMNILNRMVEEDSGGAMRNTFEEDELLEGVSAVLLNTLYVRARWRADPTLLNGTRPFRDAGAAPPRATRMIRINDVMRYADLLEWDAEALEISYSKPGLSLLLLVPRGRSLRTLAERAAAASLDVIIATMAPKRVAATLPIYTLRMTLLLPNKLESMGIERLLDYNGRISGAADTELRLSHAVQRIMFWAEAGRNAYKDDGIEWNYPPELEMVVDRPYLFYVRWNNITIMNGNFVL